MLERPIAIKLDENYDHLFKIPDSFEPATLACIRIFKNKSQFKEGKVVRGKSSFVKRWKGET